MSTSGTDAAVVVVRPAPAEQRPPTLESGKGRWIAHWEPEDPDFWEATGQWVARRNLIFSILAEHVGFSVWSIWSVLVLFMGPAYGIDPAGKFLLVCVPTLVGAVLRVPYTFAVARFGGRNWTTFSAAVLLVPLILGAIVMHPGTSYGTFLLVAAFAGFGGGNFASSMANINTFYPQRRKGWALGLNAGGGNLGVAVVQLVGLLVIATAGTSAPRAVLGIYLPLVVFAALAAARRMDNLAGVRNDTHALRGAVREPHTWVMSLLYIGTFGSFIGYSFAFGLVLQTQFGRTPLQAASVTFLGPLLGSLSRPVGGRLADRLGGARVTAVVFLALAAGIGILLVATAQDSLAVFSVGFVFVFVLTGVGNGSTYKMIPAIFQAQARAAVTNGTPPKVAELNARRLSGGAIGLTGAIGAAGGLLVNLAFRGAYTTDPVTGVVGSGTPAFVTFLVFYLCCAAVTYGVYLRRPDAAVFAV
jgi:MFS transporter, NNP family, nitrate/nitrite transporter